MIRIWRGLAATAVAAGLAAGSQAAPALAAGQAAPRVTIRARSAFRPVTRDVYVRYNGTAKLTGRVAGAARGDRIELYAQEFPYRSPAALARTHLVRRSSGSTRYTFAVSPSLATRYRVELFNSAGAKRLASSSRQTVYVAADVVESVAPGPCSTHRCKRALTLTEYLPSSAVSVEQAKHVYPYAALRMGQRPRWLYLGAEHARVSTTDAALNSDQFEITLTFTYRYSGAHQPVWDWAACTKDTLAKDGLGLPGHHGCGARRVRSNVRYLG